MTEWTVFFVSDHTGVTAEAMGRSLLSQFSGLQYKTLTVPFVSHANVHELLSRIASSAPALVFSTLTEPALRERLAASGVPLFDLFNALSIPLSRTLHQAPKSITGVTHGVDRGYEDRMEAVNFALALDDGLNPDRLPEAELILTGVSRAGKTPTSLYIALQYGKRVANYPLTPDDLDAHVLPARLVANLPRLKGLTLSAERLAQIREARLPRSRYASVHNCRQELHAAETLLRQHGVPLIDSTHRSVEEIAAHIIHGKASH
ncbi:MAG TPA: pyruvate, water dikinase regulatory protein [Thiobacillaceae bacterium]|nr:pyruvate, water dikinase regulatory protein [Thiobacillaceae bacterium]